MSVSYETRYASSPEAVKKYDTTELRDEFLIDNLMQKGKINLFCPYQNKRGQSGLLCRFYLEKSGQFTSKSEWEEYLNSFSEQLKNPLQVTVK